MKWCSVTKEQLLAVTRKRKRPECVTYAVMDLNMTGVGSSTVRAEDEEKNESVQRPSPEWIAETASAFGLSEAEIAEADATANIYLENSVGIGEHPQQIEELDKQIDRIANAKEKLEVLDEFEPAKGTTL